MDNNNVADLLDLAVGLADTRQADTGAAPFILAPEGYAVHDLEKTLLYPVRKRGTVTFHDAASFIDFFNVHKDVSHIYGEVEPPKFVAVMNDSDGPDAGWRDHRAIYSCPLAREWKEWKVFAGTPRSQIDFAEFIEGHIIDIVSHGEGEPTGADMLQVATSFKAQKKVNFASGQLLHNGQVEFTFQEELQGSAGEKGQMRVPEHFFIGIPVFEGGSPYKIECKLRWRLKEGVLTMWFELVRDHKVLESAFLDIWHEIAEKTETKVWRGVPG